MARSGLGIVEEVYNVIRRAPESGLSERQIALACNGAWTPSQIRGAVNYLHRKRRIVIAGAPRYKGRAMRRYRAAVRPASAQAVPAPRRTGLAASERADIDPRARRCLALLERRGCGRSDELAEKIGCSQRQTERLLEALVADGTLVHCRVVRPGTPEAIEYRPSIVADRRINPWRGPSEAACD